MNRQRVAVLAASILMLGAGAAAAQPGKAKGKPDKPAEAAARPTQSSRRASTAEIKLIHDYYGMNRASVKPLPPGIAKNLIRGKALPPGIERTRAPDNLIIRLDPRPGHDWFLVGDRLVLVDHSSRIIDILRLF